MHQSWVYAYANPHHQLSVRDLTHSASLEYPCGHSTGPAEGDHIENWRVEKAILNPGWELDERELKTLPCSFIYWLDQNSIDPTEFLKTIFGPTNEAYEPEVVIGSIDKGSLAAYLDRCVRESAQERYCKICSPHVGKNKRGSALLQTKLAGSIPAFAILEQTVADNYHDTLRAANNARDKALLRISANDLLQEWLGRLPDGDVTIGYAPEALGVLIRSQEEPGDLADLSDRDLVRLVTLGVQDNFLLASPAFGSDLGFGKATFRPNGRPYVDGGPVPEVTLPCLYCDTTFLARTSGQTSNIARHLLTNHWRLFKRRLLQINKALGGNEAEALPPLPVGYQTQLSFGNPAN